MIQRFSAVTRLMTVFPQIFENSKFWSQPIYVVIVVDEDNDEDDKGGRHGLGKDGDNALDHHSNCQGGPSIDAGGGVGGGAAGCALFCGLIGADGKRCRQPGVTCPPNASATLSALVTSGPSSSTARTSTWTSTQTLLRRCHASPL